MVVLSKLVSMHITDVCLCIEVKVNCSRVDSNLNLHGKLPLIPMPIFLQAAAMTLNLRLVVMVLDRQYLKFSTGMQSLFSQSQ